MKTTARIAATLALLWMSAPTWAELPNDYQVLNRKSIFARDRGSRSPAPRPSSAPTAQPPVSPVLIGVIDEGDNFTAVFETPGIGSLTAVRMGESLPRNAGVLSNITLDDIEITPADQPPRRIRIGQTLEGADASAFSSYDTSSSAGAPSEASAAPNGDDVAARMRRRRKEGK